MGEMPLHVKVQGKEAPIKVTLKDGLWIPGLLFFFFFNFILRRMGNGIPCRLLSTGTIRRDGEEVVDSGTKKIYFQLKKEGPKIPLAEKKNLLTQSGSVQGNGNYAASAHASFANKKQRLTVNE